MLVAVPLILLIGTNKDLEPPDIPLHEFVANGILIALVVVLAYRIYQYKADERATTRLRQLRQQRQRIEEEELAAKAPPSAPQDRP